VRPCMKPTCLPFLFPHIKKMYIHKTLSSLSLTHSFLTSVFSFSAREHALGLGFRRGLSTTMVIRPTLPFTTCLCHTLRVVKPIVFLSALPCVAAPSIAHGHDMSSLCSFSSCLIKVIYFGRLQQSLGLSLER